MSIIACALQSTWSSAAGGWPHFLAQPFAALTRLAEGSKQQACSCLQRSASIAHSSTPSTARTAPPAQILPLFRELWCL